MNVETDTLVIGGGLAGLAAANCAASHGGRVLVLEAGPQASYLCNSRLSMGFINVAMNDIEAGRDSMLRDIDAATRGHADPALADALASHAQAALRWLRDEGVTIIKGGWRPSNRAMLAPPSGIGPGLNWPGRGGDVMLRTLEARLCARGGELQRGVRARELVMSDGACRGAVAELDGRRIAIQARNVVIADGGYQANPELMRRHVTAHPEKVLMRNALTGRGDGLAMATAAGAATTGMGGFYGHVQSRDALRNPRLWPYPTVDVPISGGLVVTSGGQRFCDEGLGGVYVANAIARLDDPLDATAIFDHRCWMTRAPEFPLPANPLLVHAGATIHAADDLATLAARAGIDATGLAITVAAFNEALAAGRPEGLSPPRTPGALRPLPVLDGPFYAVPLVAGVTYTTGGLAIDGLGRVKAEGGGLIAGLYAAGSCTGGHEGGPACGYTGGLGKALTFGYLAGRHIAGANAPG
ncbi:MAG: hypothetical protein JWN93_1943 [Hyphomicrobiales bacterium]|nr:hypothetical protein [Hyphomicrobiales bacterium]